MIRFPTDIFFNEMSINLPSSCKLFIKHLQWFIFYLWNCPSNSDYLDNEIFIFLNPFSYLNSELLKRATSYLYQKYRGHYHSPAPIPLSFRQTSELSSVIYLPLFLHILHSDYVLYSL